jgi:hypothetical protein
MKGISYPFGKIMPSWVGCLWKRVMCPRGYHLLDEVVTIDEHYLVCDACDMIIYIWDIER